MKNDLTKHPCPGQCGREVPQRLFACADCWAILPRPYQQDIQKTAGLTIFRPERARALHAAIDWYVSRVKT